MAAGCWLRSGVPFLGDALPGYTTVVIGTMLVAVTAYEFQTDFQLTFSFSSKFFSIGFCFIHKSLKIR